MKITVSEAKKKFNRDIPPGKYEARQEELIRTINEKILSNPKSTTLNFLKLLRDTLMEEQNNLNGPTMAFIQGCNYTGRLDLLK